MQIILKNMLIGTQITDISAAGGDPAELKNAILAAKQKEALKYATMVAAIAPILFVYPFMQKYFEKGIMVGSLKG